MRGTIITRSTASPQQRVKERDGPPLQRQVNIGQFLSSSKTCGKRERGHEGSFAARLEIAKNRCPAVTQAICIDPKRIAWRERNDWYLLALGEMS
jgi:hypothetical protein